MAVSQVRTRDAIPERPLLPPRATTDGTHRRLLEEALIRFGQRGYHGVSVREIAEAAGIKASSLYSHLESKEQLLFQLMHIGHEEHLEHLRGALLESSAEPGDQVEHLMRAHVVMHATYPELARICNREMAALSPGSLEQVEKLRQGAVQLFVDVIGRGVRLGAFSAHDPWLATAALGAMGIRVAEWWDSGGAYDVDDVASTYGRYALQILAGPAEGVLG